LGGFAGVDELVAGDVPGAIAGFPGRPFETVEGDVCACGTYTRTSRAYHVHTHTRRTRIRVAHTIPPRSTLKHARINFIPLPVIVDSASGQSTHSKECLQVVAPAAFCPEFGLPAVGPSGRRYWLAGLGAVARRRLEANCLQTPRSSPANSRGNRRLAVPVWELQTVARSAVAHSALSIPGKQARPTWTTPSSCTPEHSANARLPSAMQTDTVHTAISRRSSVLPVQ